MNVALAKSTSPEASGPVWAFLFGSLVLHAALFAALAGRPPKAAASAPGKAVELVIFEVQQPTPPPARPPVPPKVPIRVASVRALPPQRPEQAGPPPPNETPPPEAPPKQAPLVVGLSMESTTSAGGFSAAVGNTAYGKTADTAQAPSTVQPYAAPKYAPIYQVDSAPSVLSEVKIPYPDQARRAGVEGTVTLSITVDAEGNVVTAQVVKGPGYGLEEAARQAILSFKFKPARKDGEAVSTEMKYSYTFLLD